jgi:hypothetical protein
MNTAPRRKPPQTETRKVATCLTQATATATRLRSGAWRLGSVLVATAIVTACASSVPKYEEPKGATASAKVRVVNTRPWAYYADIAIFDAAACFDRADLGMTGGNSRDGVRIGMMDDKPPSPGSIERHVRAGEPLVIGPRAVFPTASLDDIMHALMPDSQEQMRTRQAGVCRIPSFVPKLNEQYEVLVELTPAHCSVKPYRLVDSNGTVAREEVPSQLSQISTFEFDMKCFK